MTTLSLPTNSTNVRNNAALGSLRLGLRLSSRLGLSLALNWAERLFLRAPKHRRPASEQACLERAECGTLYTAGMPQLEWDGVAMRTYRWGRPTLGRIAVLHGWGGRATQFHALIEAFVAAGYEVVGIDAVGHGDSEDAPTSVLHLSNALERLVRAFGQVDAVIAHSMGGAAAINALADGLPVGRAVLIASAADLTAYSRFFAHTLRLDESLRLALQARIERRFGSPWSQINAFSRATELQMPALFLHDQGDQDVPLRVSSALAQAWRGAQLHTTQGLGHRRILKDPKTVARVVAFITQVPQA